MPPRSFWKGYLKLSLVTCPVAMTPALSDGAQVRFHTINAKTGNRVQRRFVDSVTGKPVAEDNEVKGFPKGEDGHVILEDDEIDAVGLESTRTIDIQTFVPADSIGWIWYDRPHFLTPDDKVGEEAFSVIREAMRATKTVGIARLVLYRRERAVMLQPKGRGIVLWTLRYGDEVRAAGDHFSHIDSDKPQADHLKLVTKLITSRVREWTPDMVDDPVQKRLLDIIKARRKGKAPARKGKPAKSEPADNVVSIMDALKRSIAAEKRRD